MASASVPIYVNAIQDGLVLRVPLVYALNLPLAKVAQKQMVVDGVMKNLHVFQAIHLKFYIVMCRVRIGSFIIV